MLAKTDQELLAEYAETGADPAFAAIVQRYGPLVMGTCLRILGRREDAEDAAQAVFFVLARKAASLARSENLGSWLHRVAWHVSRRHQTSLQRRRIRERQAGAELPSGKAEAVGPLLDDALNRLPEKYRRPIIHVHLEGRSMEEGAALEGCTPAALAQRLCRGRSMLRERLARVGIAVTLGALIQELAAAAEGTGVAVAPGSASAAAAALAKGAGKAMIVAKLKVAAAVMAVAVLGGTAGLAGYRATAEGQEPATRVASPAPKVKGLSQAEVEQALALIRLSPGEDPSSEIPWLTDVDAAQRKAAAEGKPLFVFANGGEPLGGT